MMTERDDDGERCGQRGTLERLAPSDSWSMVVVVVVVVAVVAVRATLENTGDGDRER
jgi:hypothetical protein